ncbi:MAG TPA: hypothetical protein VIK06_02925 [Candidatus Limnocylindrales bacterium]|jgi:hypothetical protein
MRGLKIGHLATSTFGAAGTLQRTLELSADRAPVAMAAVPAGSSLATGNEPNVGATATGHLAAEISSSKPPSTSTLVDSVSAIASEKPVQGALAVAFAILLGYWLLVHGFDRRGRQTR